MKKEIREYFSIFSGDKSWQHDKINPIGLVIGIIALPITIPIIIISFLLTFEF